MCDVTYNGLFTSWHLKNGLKMPNITLQMTIQMLRKYLNGLTNCLTQFH